MVLTSALTLADQDSIKLIEIYPKYFDKYWVGTHNIIKGRSTVNLDVTFDPDCVFSVSDILYNTMCVADDKCGTMTPYRSRTTLFGETFTVCKSLFSADSEEKSFSLFTMEFNNHIEGLNESHYVPYFLIGGNRVMPPICSKFVLRSAMKERKYQRTLFCSNKDRSGDSCESKYGIGAYGNIPDMLTQRKIEFEDNSYHMSYSLLEMYFHMPSCKTIDYTDTSLGAGFEVHTDVVDGIDLYFDNNRKSYTYAATFASPLLYTNASEHASDRELGGVHSYLYSCFGKGPYNKHPYCLCSNCYVLKSGCTVTYCNLGGNPIPNDFYFTNYRDIKHFHKHTIPGVSSAFRVVGDVLVQVVKTATVLITRLFSAMVVSFWNTVSFHKRNVYAYVDTFDFSNFMNKSIFFVLDFIVLNKLFIPFCLSVLTFIYSDSKFISLLVLLLSFIIMPAESRFINPQMFVAYCEIDRDINNTLIFDDTNIVVRYGNNSFLVDNRFVSFITPNVRMSECELSSSVFVGSPSQSVYNAQLNSTNVCAAKPSPDCKYATVTLRFVQRICERIYFNTCHLARV